MGALELAVLLPELLRLDRGLSELRLGLFKRGQHLGPLGAPLPLREHDLFLQHVDLFDRVDLAL